MSWEIRFYRNIHWNILANFEELALKNVKADPSRRFLLVSEVRPTFTFGLNAKKEDLLWTNDLIKNKNIEIHAAKRGGKWTYHGPGQIIIFPIADLTRLGYGIKDIKKYIFDLRLVVANFLIGLGVKVELKEELPFGIYIGNEKIVSFGIGVKRGICHHGFSLNLKKQKDFFSGIVPCGCKESGVTSLEELGIILGWEEVAFHLVTYLKNSFK